MRQLTLLRAALTLLLGLPFAFASYSSAQSVFIADLDVEATIYYTTDGSTPTTLSSIYTVPITVSSTETLRAIAVDPNYADSRMATAAYWIK
jgi:hypothetical protein